MAETAVTDLDLPPGVRLDPRRGQRGGEYRRRREEVAR